MKRILTVTVMMCLGAVAYGQPYAWHGTNTVNAVIADNNASGYADTMGVGGLADNIADVTVSLDITGGYNGDLYAYLAGPNGGFAVLLNRVGVTNGNAFGYSDAGMNITLDDSASNPDIHSYQASVNPLGGQLTGTWGSDGENIDPQSAPAAFSGSGGATLLTFDNDGYNGNGNWTLFLADLAAGNQSTLVSWSLDITTVPEPSTLALATLAAALAAARKLRRRN